MTAMLTEPTDQLVRDATGNYHSWAEMRRFLEAGTVPTIRNTSKGTQLAEVLLDLGHAVYLAGKLRMPGAVAAPIAEEPAEEPARPAVTTNAPPPPPKASPPPPKTKTTNNPDRLGLLTLGEAAAAMRISIRGLQRLAERCELARVRVGRRTLFRQADLERYVSRRAR